MTTASPKHRICYGQPIPQHVITESTESARSWFAMFPDTQFTYLEWEPYAWPGGYEIHYITKDGGVLCHQCANDNLMLTINPDYDQWFIVEPDINYEDPHCQCDHCYRVIEPAYGESE